jgi:uncharacterized protein YqfB (UPF0267 family)
MTILDLLNKLLVLSGRDGLWVRIRSLSQFKPNACTALSLCIWAVKHENIFCTVLCNTVFTLLLSELIEIRYIGTSRQVTNSMEKPPVAHLLKNLPTFMETAR